MSNCCELYFKRQSIYYSYLTFVYWLFITNKFKFIIEYMADQQ